MSLESVIHLTNVRLSFPHIATPQEKTKEDGSKRVSYSADFIMSPDNPGWAKFHELVNKMAVEKWKEKAPAAMQQIQQDPKKRCYRWGQEKVKASDFTIYAGYEGNVAITAGRDKMPQMIDGDGNPIDPLNTGACMALARTMYGGCYVNAAIKPWLQQNVHGIGVRCDLVAVQFFADGESFGEAVTDASALFTAAPGAGAPGGDVPPWAPPAVPGAPPAFAAPPQFNAPPAFVAPVASLPPFLH